MSWLNIAVVGGINLDILGSPEGTFVMRDSVIGTVQFSSGGVGHNIAVQAARTGADVSLFTVFGSDRNAEWLRQSCLEDGLRIEHSVSLPGRSSVYLAIHDESGDMLTAINDMALMKQFSTDVLETMLPFLDQADVCVFDANLPEESLIYLSRHAAVPLVCDPVSTEKATRLGSVLPFITAIKPNLMEAQALTERKSKEDCAAALLDKGVKKVFISLGKNGVYYADAKTAGCIAPSKVTLKPQTGAGDALTAGIASGIGLGYNTEKCAVLGMETVAKYLQLI